MGMQGTYPIGSRTLAATDSCTGVVTALTADIPLSVLSAFIAAHGAGTMSGTTAQRPIPVFVGQPYFDITLGFMVWAKQLSPAIWVDAAGVSV